MKLEVVGTVIAANDVDDTLDALSLQIERAMDADETFGGVCGKSILESAEIAVSVEGKRPMAQISMIYAVRYYTNAPEADDVTPNDFTGADITYDVNDAVEPDDRAQDTLDALDDP